MEIYPNGPRSEYEKFRARMPKYLIGFRGQSNEFTRQTLENGFDRSREYFVVDLNLNWNQMRKRFHDLHHKIHFSLDWGYNPYFPPRDKSVNVGPALEYYKDHPDEYNSLLLLRFPGIKGRIFATRPNKEGDWSEKKVPKEFIAGTITLSKEDFQATEDKLQKISGNLEGKDFSEMHRRLSRLFVRRFLEAVTQLPAK